MRSLLIAGLALALATSCRTDGPHRLDRVDAAPSAAATVPEAPAPDPGPTPRSPAAAPLSPAPASAGLGFPPAGDAVVATVLGESLRKSQVYEHLRATWPDKVQAAIAVLVGNRVLAAEAARAGIAVPESEITAWWREHREDLERRVRVEYGPETTPETFFRDVLGQSEAEYRAAACDRERAKRLLGRVIRYQAIREDRVVLRIISVDDSAEARRIAGFLREGAAFEGLARRFSAHPSAAEGGLMSPVPRGVLSPGLDAAAFALPEGGISDAIPAEGRDGVQRWQIVRLERRIPGRDVPWAAVEEEVRRSLDVRPLDADEWYIWQLRVDRQVQMTR